MLMAMGAAPECQQAHPTNTCAKPSDIPPAGVRLAATEGCLQLNDRLATLAIKPLRNLSEKPAHALMIPLQALAGLHAL